MLTVTPRVVVKASAWSAADLGLIPSFSVRMFTGGVIPVTYTLVLHWLPWQASGAVGSTMGLIGPVSVHCVYTHTHTGTLAHRHTHRHTLTRARMHTRTHARTLACTHARTHTHTIYTHHNLIYDHLSFFLL